MATRLLISALTLLLAACSVSADKSAAEAGVDRFHRMMTDGEYEAIYVAAADEFKRQGSRDDAIRFLRVVDGRMGAVRRAQQLAWRVNFVSGGNIVNLRYDTEFENGRGTEDFVFRVNGNATQLVGYHINSTELAPIVPRNMPQTGDNTSVVPASAETNAAETTRE